MWTPTPTWRTAPYIVVRMTGGEIADDKSPQTVEFSLIICAYDTGIERDGFQDVANIKEDIVQRACTAPYFGGAFTILKPIAWALQQRRHRPVLLRSCDHELYSAGHDPRHRIGGTAMSKKNRTPRGGYGRAYERSRCGGGGQDCRSYGAGAGAPSSTAAPACGALPDSTPCTRDHSCRAGGLHSGPPGGQGAAGGRGPFRSGEKQPGQAGTAEAILSGKSNPNCKKEERTYV